MIQAFKKGSKPSARKSTSVVPPGFIFVSIGSHNSRNALWRYGKLCRQSGASSIDAQPTREKPEPIITFDAILIPMELPRPTTQAFLLI
jgi:hypothetical protein